MPKKRIIIIGAGLAGLSAAWHLKRKGMDCVIFEKEPVVGGLCRSKDINGFTFDYDGHLLHFRDRYTFGLVRDLLKGNLMAHKRSAWVYSHKRFIPYPFQANLRWLPKQARDECVLGFVRAKEGAKRTPLNFSEWLNRSFGSGIARHFMLPYNNKFWTVPAEELTCEWTSGFIPVLSYEQIMRGAMRHSADRFGYNARFWYPKKGGIQELPLALAAGIKNLRTGCPVTEIDLVQRQLKTKGGEKERFDYLLSTVALPELPALIKGLPKDAICLFEKLRWNSIFNLNLGIEGGDGFGRHWLYFPDEKFEFFRVGFWHNFSAAMAPSGKTSLYVELSYSKHKPIKRSGLISRIKNDLIKIGILKHRDKVCVQDISDIKYGYPIYDKNYRKAREGILKYLASQNMFSFGRYGSWRYFSMEDAILDGRRAARAIYTA